MFAPRLPSCKLWPAAYQPLSLCLPLLHRHAGASWQVLKLLLDMWHEENEQGQAHKVLLFSNSVRTLQILRAFLIREVRQLHGYPHSACCHTTADRSPK